MDNKINRASAWNKTGEGAVWDKLISILPMDALQNTSTDPDYVKVKMESSISDELLLYLADQISKNFGVRIPIKNPDLFNLVTTRNVINQADLANKKKEC